MFRTTSQKCSNDLQKITCPVLFQNTNFSINKHSTISTKSKLKNRLINKHISDDKRKKTIKNETNNKENDKHKKCLTSHEKPLFSLLDINDRITNSKGPSFPAQYTRRSIKDFETLLGTAFAAQLLKKNRNIARFFKCKRHLLIKQQEENIKNNELINISDNANTTIYSRLNDYQTRAKPLINHDSAKKKKVVSSQDIFNNPNDKSKINNCSLEIIRAKAIASDIFFLKGKTDNDYLQKTADYPDFQNSDIFLLKIAEEEKSKTREKKKSYYNNARESKSAWHTKNFIPTLLNYSSTEFNIITNKCQSIPKSKKEIENECERIGTSLNPLKRQKSLSEYIDLTRVSNPNSNLDFMKYYNEHPQPFNRIRNICSEHLDNHRRYTNLCELPFVKKKF